MSPAEIAEKFLADKHLDEPVLSHEWLEKMIAESNAEAVKAAFGTENKVLSLPEFLRELTGSEPESRTAPGLQLSWLESRKMYYAAIHVFPMGTVESRHVLIKSLDADLTQCLIKLLLAYRESKT